MPLPRKVKQQLDAADALLKQANAPVETPAPVEAQAPEPEPAAKPEAQPSTPEAQPAKVSAPVEAPAPVESAPNKDKDLEQKYRTLQGIHRYLDDRVKQLEQRNAQLASQLEAAAKPAQETKPETPVDPKDSEVFGEDLVEMVSRVAERMFGAAAKKFESRLTAIEQQLQGTANTVNRTAEEVFYDRLGTLVPDYKELNVDEGFLSWLAEEDPVYGVPRQEALTGAANAMDVNRVAKVFMAYKGTLAPSVPSPKPTPSPLDKQIAPSSVAPAPVQAAGKPTYTVSEVQAFYKDMQLGKYRGREAEADKVEALINAALAEGRIVDRPMRASAA